MIKTRSFLKWVGGKYSCLDKILAHFPLANRLIEPFSGSGVIFMNTDYPEHVLAEDNEDLINLFNQIKIGGDDFISYCQKYFCDENISPENYYKLRDKFNARPKPRERAALFLYLNRHGFNGLCRFNGSGAYNVPIGRFKKIRFPLEEMRIFHKKSQKVTLIHADFRITFAKAKAGDLIYCDPPYAPIEQTSNFSSYTSNSFTEQDQIDLATLANQYTSLGVTTIISNHDTYFTRDIYNGSRIFSFNVSRSVNRDVSGRKPVREVLAIFIPTKIK